MAKQGVGESRGSRKREREQLCSVPSQSVNSFSFDSWRRLSDLLFSPLEMQAGRISYDLAAGEGEERSPSLQIRSNLRRLVLSHQDSIRGEAFPKGWGLGFPALSQGRVNLAGCLFNSSELSARAECPLLPRCAPVCGALC